MRLTKIYTKVGDKGKTMLASGERVAKDDVRIEAYGTIDELNAFIGWLRDEIHNAHSRGFDDILMGLLRIQNEMHDIGGELATPTNVLDTTRQQVVSKDSIDRLESEIDTYNDGLAPLENFVLPGGNRINSMTQVCRTICRRAERRLWSLSKQEEVREEPIVYINRLSDWFFVVGRTASKRLDCKEVLWNQAGKH